MLAKKADKDGLAAQVALAIRYGKGDGVPKNSKEAFKWMLKAAEQGDITVHSLI